MGTMKGASMGVRCIRFLRQAHQWLAKLPWLGLLLLWNGVGGALSVYAFLVIILEQYAIRLPDPPEWCVAVFFFFWFLPMPFTTLGVIVRLWSSRQSPVSKLLLLYSLVVFAVWTDWIVLFVTAMVSNMR